MGSPQQAIEEKADSTNKAAVSSVAPAGHPQAGPAAWPGSYGMGPPGSQPFPWRDYAQEKPDQFYAFLNHVRPGPDGVDIILSDRMCLDKHVEDLTACVESWLLRHFGHPPVSGQTWRLGTLDLSRNSLSDSSIAKVLDRLKRSEIRVVRLLLDANIAGTKATTALSEYLWNNPEAVMEIGLADNEISVSADSAGNDCVSALLRCLYNHSAYPLKKQTDVGVQIAPVTLRLHGNRICDYSGLLDRIRDKVGSTKVRFTQDERAYTGGREEFLSVFLPRFHDQRVAAGHREPQDGGQLTESTSRRKRKHRASSAADEAPQPTRTKQMETPGEPAEVQVVAAGKSTVVQEAAKNDDEDSFGSSFEKYVKDLEGRKILEQEIEKHMKTLPELKSTDMTAELAELAVSLGMAKSKPSEVSKELEGFIGEASKKVIAWLKDRLQAA
eukprot:CAMPEP_0178418132 /NCGR_PEP_ID=MMETSP0689_2-20121128/24931_1 /TAXON_ID=160604 /ORGANISM="Amphidinium massartii, Strain CS-259" /LENGTH=440 /DNA_ID=CAMNT_0020039517 /DNA_START=117 /DNA_END=1440 /DNA_ORIENTATION=+